MRGRKDRKTREIDEIDPKEPIERKILTGKAESLMRDRGMGPKWGIIRNGLSKVRMDIWFRRYMNLKWYEIIRGLTIGMRRPGKSRARMQRKIWGSAGLLSSEASKGLILQRGLLVIQMLRPAMDGFVFSYGPALDNKTSLTRGRGTLGRKALV